MFFVFLKHSFKDEIAHVWVSQWSVSGPFFDSGIAEQVIARVISGTAVTAGIVVPAGVLPSEPESVGGVDSAVVGRRRKASENE